VSKVFHEYVSVVVGLHEEVEVIQVFFVGVLEQELGFFPEKFTRLFNVGVNGL
jgi:hypothetical protein